MAVFKGSSWTGLCSIDVPSVYCENARINAYFQEDKQIPSPKGTARFEMPIGKQAQLDWKESIPCFRLVASSSR